MELFVGSFIVFVFAALAMAIGIIFRGRTMHAGCRRLPGDPGCETELSCGGVCGGKD